MEHLGWFFAGSSLGMFVGVFVMSLTRMAEMCEQQSDVDPGQSSTETLFVVKR